MSRIFHTLDLNIKEKIDKFNCIKICKFLLVKDTKKKEVSHRLR